MLVLHQQPNEHLKNKNQQKTAIILISQQTLATFLIVVRITIILSALISLIKILESRRKQYDMTPVSKSHASSSLLKIIETNKGVFLHVHNIINLVLK